MSSVIMTAPLPVGMQYSPHNQRCGPQSKRSKRNKNKAAARARYVHMSRDTLKRICSFFNVVSRYTIDEFVQRVIVILFDSQSCC